MYMCMLYIYVCMYACVGRYWGGGAILAATATSMFTEPHKVYPPIPLPLPLSTTAVTSGVGSGRVEVSGVGSSGSVSKCLEDGTVHFYGIAGESYTDIHIYMHIFIYISYTYMHIYIHTHLHLNIHAYILTYILHILTCTHIYPHT